MLSVIVHVSGKPLDWHLVEPLFYKGLASKQMHFFSITSSSHTQRYHQLYWEVYHYLQRNQIDRWQLILLMSREHPDAYRMGTTLEHIHHDFVQPFRKQRLLPVNRIAVVMNERDGKSHVDEMILELDRKGYVDVKSDMSLNHFTLPEIQSLDAFWGEPLDLRTAGTIDEPNDLFLEELLDRAKQVKQGLAMMVEEKRQFTGMNKNALATHRYHMLTTEVLEAIYQEFEEAMNRLIEPPLPFSLTTYKPSEMLEKVLKANVSLSSAIKEFRIMRVSNCDLSPFQQTEYLLRAAFLVNLIAMYPAWIDRIRKSSVHLVTVKFDEKELARMFRQYDSNLEVALGKMSDRDLEGHHFMTSVFTDTTLLPNFSEALPNVQDAPPVFKWRTKRSFGADWIAYLQDIEQVLKEREDQLVEEAQEGVWNLGVSKRQDHLFQIDKNVNILKYLQELKQKRYTLQNEMEDAAPSLRVGLSKWKKYADRASDNMFLFLSSFPSFTIIVLTMLTTLLFFIIPFRSSLFLAHSAGMILIIALLSFLSVIKLIKPIQELRGDTVLHQEELVEVQSESLAAYNDYLNKLYHLNRVSKQITYLENTSDQKKQENVLYRWHQRKVRDHLMLAKRFVYQFSTDEYPDVTQAERIYESFFTIETDVIHNPLYSLLDANVGKGSDHRIEVKIGHSKEMMDVRHLKQVKGLILEEDQVLLL